MSQEKEEPKQDTIERAIEIYANEFNGEISKIVKDAIEYYQYLCLLFGDKLQQEQEKMYSKEDVITILESLVEHPTKPGYKRGDILKVIEQYKKK